MDVSNKTFARSKISVRFIINKIDYEIYAFVYIKNIFIIIDRKICRLLFFVLFLIRVIFGAFQNQQDIFYNLHFY